MAEEKGTILFIEDSARYQRMYGTLLKAENYGLLRAMDGEMGFLLAKKKVPDLILMEMLLPKKHGLDVIRDLRLSKETKEIPIIVFSVSGKDDDIKGALHIGANDYLVKGYQTPREVIEKIRLLIGRKASELSSETYHVMIYERKGDAARLQRDINLTTLFRCPTCNEELVLALSADDKKEKEEGHYFSAHFICPLCKKNF
ncbi:MAG: response regulator [bacterium]